MTLNNTPFTDYDDIINEGIHTSHVNQEHIHISWLIKKQKQNTEGLNISSWMKY